ncbi:alpha-1,2-fucosyltransferase [Phocaeicola coprophilus]|jgi:hypothetical protein|uniref:alpha-1,2-fucosyltransferase n=1 Tax=Phocaeicola coprophilus TaxID=387090 RepID=UPI0026DC1148|nr:alpha-1,2-fucosyltransferase [Phocaeicola coprophilus]
MITTTLRGGLGNQMFMYAMVKAMAIKNKTAMAFNLHEGFDNDFQYQRKLELQYLNVDLGKHAPFAVFDYKGARYAQIISKKIGRNILLPQYQIIEEKSPMRFQSELINEHILNAYLEGYWQSEKYFKNIEDQIRTDFTIKALISESVKAELRNIREGNHTLIFVGIRRYQECSQVRPGMVLNEDYYNKAIKYFENRFSNVKFVIFSQQPEWAKQKLITKSPMIFANAKSGDLATIEDLYLMTHCDHAIISNSSFYWWGAWLQNTSKNHLVIAPDNFINKDSVCADWIIIGK